MDEGKDLSCATTERYSAVDTSNDPQENVVTTTDSTDLHDVQAMATELKQDQEPLRQSMRKFKRNIKQSAEGLRQQMRHLKYKFQQEFDAMRRDREQNMAALNERVKRLSGKVGSLQRTRMVLGRGMTQILGDVEVKDDEADGLKANGA